MKHSKKLSQKISPRFLNQITDPPKAYRPVAFWFLNGRLEPEEMVRQVREMAAQGMGGIMCHARDGLRTAYLSEEWRLALDAAMAEAERQGMEVWLYDENHYPSGPAGGLLPLRFPDRTMKSMAVLWERTVDAGMVIEAEIDNAALSHIAVAASLDKPLTADLSSHLRHQRLHWRVPRNWGRSVVLILGEIPWTPPPSYKLPYFPDYLDPDLTDEFITITHKWYHQAFGKRFGKTIRGIFSDNSCGNFGHIRRSVPWGRDFEARFNRKTGAKLRELLPALFYPQAPGSERARLIFWRFFGQTYLDSYFGRIKKYCDQVGIYSTGHLCLENGMGEHVRQIGDYFEVMRNFSFCSIDQLGPAKTGVPLYDSCGEFIAAPIKNASSAARFLGSPRVMCESFGLASGPWALDIFELRRISGWLFALGVDLFAPHGLYYSIAGGRKWECTPDHFHSPLWTYYSEWTNWISRLSLAGAGGANRADVAILYPIHSLRAVFEVGKSSDTPGVGGVKKVDWNDPSTSELPAQWDPNVAVLPEWADHGQKSNFIEATYHFAHTALVRENVDYEVIDEEFLATASISDSGNLKVPAPQKRDAQFSVLVLPAVTFLEKRSVALIERFLCAGGKVICLNAVPDRTFEPRKGTVDEIRGPFAGLGAPLAQENLESKIIWTKTVGRGVLEFVAIRPHREDWAAEKFFAERLFKNAARHVTIEAGDNRRPDIVTRSWSKGRHRFYFAFNATRKPIPHINVRTDESEPLTRIDLQTGARLKWDPAIPYDFEPAEGILLATGLSPDRKLPLRTVSTQDLEIIPIDGAWSFSTDKPNVLPLRQWTSQTQDQIHTHRFLFNSDIELADAWLLMDLERTPAELDSHAYGARVRFQLNDQRITRFQLGQYLDRNIYEARLEGVVKAGENTLDIVHSYGCQEGETRLWPPLIVGDFGVDRTGENARLVAPVRTVTAGSWVEQGLPFFAGEGIYTRTITLPTVTGSEHWILDLGNVASACRVEIEGRLIGTRSLPPWTFDLTDWAGRTVGLTVRVANTPNNVHVSTLLPAGLLGPAVLKRNYNKETRFNIHVSEH